VLKEAQTDIKKVDKEKFKPYFDLIQLWGRRERILHGDLCKKLKENPAEFIEKVFGKESSLKPLIDAITSSLTTEKL
jgi:hypothetical protein